MQTTQSSPWNLGLQLLNVEPQSLAASYEARCTANTPFLYGNQKGNFRSPRARCIIQFLYDRRNSPEGFPVRAVIKHLMKNKQECARSTASSDLSRLSKFTCGVLERVEIPEYRRDGNSLYGYRFNNEFDHRSLTWLKR